MEQYTVRSPRLLYPYGSQSSIREMAAQISHLLEVSQVRLMELEQLLKYIDFDESAKLMSRSYQDVERSVMWLRAMLNAFESEEHKSL